MIMPSALAVLFVFAAACAASGGSNAQASLDEAVGGLCQATSLAQGGDVDAAAAAFQHRAHDYLHVLADDLSDRDRVATARLLQAKQRVEEALFDSGAEVPGQTADLLRDLQAALAQAATAAGLDPSGCGEDAA